MITVRLQCLVPRRFGVEDANYDGRLLLPILRHEKWVILHVRNCPPFLLLRVKGRERRVAVRPVEPGGGKNVRLEFSISLGEMFSTTSFGSGIARRGCRRFVPYGIKHVQV